MPREIEEIDKEKSIMGYKVKFKTEFDESDNNGDFKFFINLF